MKTLYYELRKEFIRKSFLLIFGTFVIANVFLMEWDYHTNGGFSEDYVKAYVSDKQNLYYGELHRKLDGKLDAEKVSYISDEYLKDKEAVSGDYSKEYDETTHTGYIWGDYAVINSYFYSPIKYLVTYKEQNDLLLRNAKQNINFFTEKNNSYEVEKSKFIVKHYKDRNPLLFYETSGWKNLFLYDKSDMFILILLLLGILPSFSLERKNAMETIQMTCAPGSKLYIPIKIMAHALMAIVFELVFSICNFIVINSEYGLTGSKMMLYSINAYQYTPFNMSVLEFYLVLVLSKCIGFAIIAIVLTLIARLVRNTYAAFLIIIGSVCSFLYFSGFNGGITMREKILTLISPFSLLKIGEMSTSLGEIKICGHFLPFSNCLLGIQTILLILVFIIFYLIEKREKEIR